jgi:hypothetical protein
MRRNGITLLDVDEDGNTIKVSNQSVMIAYKEEDKKVCSIDHSNRFDYEENFFVFFPTQIPSGCQFLVHAPFVTKSSRDTIARNNEANDELMKQLGILIADSMIVLAKEKQLSVDLMEELFFADKEERFGKNKLIYENFKGEYEKLLREKRALVPCLDGSYHSLQTVLFTSESKTTCETLVRLFGFERLSSYFPVQKVTGICYVQYSDFFEFISDTFACKKMEVLSILQILKAEDYEKEDTIRIG